MNDTAPAARNPLPLWRIALWGGVGAILMLPAVAMRYTAEVQWTAFDFVFAGLVLGVAAALFEVVMMTTRRWQYRLLGGLTVLCGVMLFWGAAVRGLI